VEPMLLGTSTEKLTFWLAKGDIVLTKNVNLHGEYAFHISAKDEDDYRDNPRLRKPAVYVLTGVWQFPL